MLESHFRQAATLFLKSAIRIAPEHTRDWGRGMLAELFFVENPWAAGAWAFGGGAVLAKSAALSLLMPSRYGPSAVPDGGVFATNNLLRRVAVVCGAACVLGALIFIAAPPFRQGLRMGLQPWGLMFGIRSVQPAFAELSKRAAERSDANALALCAVRVADPRASARLAKQAVRLDSSLAWIYAVVALRHPELPEITSWIPELERADPDNAIVHLIRAESVFRAGFPSGTNREDMPSWQNAMTTAFNSSKFDDYLDQVTELNGRVVTKYGFFDPYEVESRADFDAPSSAFENSKRFANFLLDTGAASEMRGEQKAAEAQYWTVARFGQLIDSQGRTASARAAGMALQSRAYQRLERVSEKAGNPADARLFAYLADRFDADPTESSPDEGSFTRATARRNAAVVQISGLMIIIFLGLLATAGLIFGFSHREKAGPAARRAKPVAAIVILTSAVGLLFSAATLYVTYRPYWYMFQAAVLGGRNGPSRDLSEFLAALRAQSEVSGVHLMLNSLVYSGSMSSLFYFWAGVALLSVFCLCLILARNLLGRPPARTAP